MPLIDIGANLAHDSFGSDRGAVLERAAAAGLEAVIITGSNAVSSRRALELAQAASPLELYATAGLHPHHASEWNAGHAALFRELGLQQEIVALGECGLDYFRDLSPRTDQRRAFTAQLELAAEIHKPVFLHQRDAHTDFLPILREFRPQLAGAVVHCFTDTEAALGDYLALDCHIGITGWICDERRGQNLLPLLKQIPQNRLLLETDAPYLLPRTIPRPVLSPSTGSGQAPPRGGRVEGRNEPMYLPWVAQAVAQARDETPQQVAAFTTANARRFFPLPVNQTLVG